MKKLKCITLILIVLALMLIIPNVSNAATIQATETTITSTGKNVTWSYELDSNNNILNLKCTNISSISGELTIPSTIDGYTVLTIGNTKNNTNNGAFENCPGITGITIPNTVTAIGYRAFYNCTGLKTLTLPNSVNSLGQGAFCGCTGLTSITFSDNLTSIGSGAFQNCTGLKSISLPSSLTTIGSGAFESCTGFAEIVIPDNVTTIEGRAFYGCAGLKNITLSKNITKINNMTFKNCSGLTSVIIPESVTTIEGGYNWQGAFGECTNLEKILIPDSVATIGENAFVDCNKLTIYGNDNQASKTFAETYSINFKYIEEWDESDVGDDVTPPTVNTLRVDLGSVWGYPSESSLCYVPAGKSIKIYVNFSELITGETAPTLIIKCGSGENIEVSSGVISGSSVVYTYTIREQDKGIMTAVKLSGGDVTDESGNAAQLSCPELRIENTGDHVYANGTGVSSNNGGNSNEGTNNGSNAGTGTQNGTVQGSGTTGNKEENKIDNTTATGKLPQAGLTIGLTVSIVVLLAVCVFVYFKYNKLRGI